MANRKRTNKKLLKKVDRFSFPQLYLIAVAFAIVGSFALWKSLAATTSSVVVDQPNPQYGQQITLTAVYPSAARKKIGRRQMFQPQINLSCIQNATTAYYQISSAAKETNLGGGWWQGTSGTFTLGGNTSVGNNSYSWPGGSADCTGFSGYFTTDSTSALYWHSLGSVSFHVN